MNLVILSLVVHLLLVGSTLMQFVNIACTGNVYSVYTVKRNDIIYGLG